jgi:PAS domain S-box-containing protein
LPETRVESGKSRCTRARADATLAEAIMSGNVFGLTAVFGLLVVYLSFLVARARRTAAASVARQHDLIELAPDAFFLADLDGRFTDVNATACRLLGYERDELLCKTIGDIIPPEELPRLAAVRATMLSRGQPTRGEWRHRRKDGTVVSVEVSSNILPGGRWQAFVRDITERKRAERELRFSEARLAGIVSISTDAIISVDESRKIVLFNEGAERLFGYAPSEIVGASLDVLVPGPFHAVDRQVEERLNTITGRRKGGEEFPVEAAISKLEVEGRSILNIAIRDVAVRKRIEAEQRFVSEAGAELATSLDFEQTLATLGRLMVRDFADWCIVDVVEDEERPRRLKAACAQGDPAALIPRLEQIRIDRRLPHLAGPVLKTGRPYLLDDVTPAQLASYTQSDEHLRVLRAIGPRSIMALPLSVRGQLIGVLLLLATGSRRYGAADLRVAEAIAERAAFAIENGRLYQTALHATQLRDEVLSVVAHDLRNPAATIIMQATAMRRRGGEPERRNQKPIESILRTARRMNRLIGDLLDVSLIEMGKLSVEHARLPARQMLLDAVEAQRPMASSGGIDMRLEVSDDLPDIWGDPHRLTQVFENLIGNALKFTPAEGRITVGAAPRDSEVLLWVADTGSGIAPEGLPHVFDRFWQAVKGAQHGVGLGLPIARGIIEAHGGRIWVESILGRGSVFFFTLPTASALGAEAGEALQ